MKKLYPAAASFLIAFALFMPQLPPARAAERQHAQPHRRQSSGSVLYYCPMHPSYTSPKPGECPICNMSLVRDEDAAEGMGEAAAPEGAFRISPYRQQLIGVRTDTVRYRDMPNTVSTSGRVAFDPELYALQQEFIEMVKAHEKVAAAGSIESARAAQSLVDAAALRLKLRGVSAAQITSLQESRANDESLLYPDAGGGAWVYAVVYEYELAEIREGQEAIVTAAAYPGRVFRGSVVSVDPVIDAATRSIRARIYVLGAQGLLKPNMYVDVKIVSDGGPRLAVPREAIVDSGERTVAFLALEDGYFRPRDLKTGLTSDEYVEVVEGLREGDTVVVSGTFLIDSESKLKAALAQTGHEH